MFALLQSPKDDFFGRMHTANQFNHDVNLRIVEHGMIISRQCRFSQAFCIALFDIKVANARYGKICMEFFF